VKRTARQRVARAEREGLCVACLEPLEGTVKRGCHERCYQATRRAVAQGKTTLEERVAEGKLLPPETPGRKPSNPVSTEFV